VINEKREANTSVKKNLEKLKRRDCDLKVVIRKVVEQNALGEIPPAIFTDLFDTYKTEQESVTAQIRAFETEIATEAKNKDNAQRFMEMIRKYKPIQELSREILLDLIEKIVVHESTGESNRWRKNNQKIEFHYRFVGELNV